MRVVRRASLIFSLTLIVAIAVGYVARRSEMSSQRDQRLSTAAQVGSSKMSAIVGAVEIAGGAGSDPVVTAWTLAQSYPVLGVCAIDSEETHCAGNGEQPSNAIVDQLRRNRDDIDVGIPVASVSEYERTIMITVEGPAVSVVAMVPADAIASGGDIRVWAITLLPEGRSIDRFVVEAGIRQTVTAVESVDRVYVVAGTQDALHLPANERQFYLLIFGLAVVLLVLAGATLVAEQRSLVERASFDQLTKLPNRGEFERRATDLLAAAERSEQSVCLMLFDLNGFKLVNDTYGHHAGDEMLRVVGSRLRKAVRDQDVVARWGGDEFVVMMPGISDIDMASKRAEQLAQQVAGRTRLDGVPDALRVKVSVGVAIWPKHGVELHTLVEAADKAMYQAKRDGDTWRIADAATPAPPAVFA